MPDQREQRRLVRQLISMVRYDGPQLVNALLPARAFSPTLRGQKRGQIECHDPMVRQS